jgi:FMN-dependent NADH-azoreductase
MRHRLLITSSPRPESDSTKVARALAEQLASREPLPHIDHGFVAARDLPVHTLTPAQKAALALSDELLRELFAADTSVRPRVTFTYSDGPMRQFDFQDTYLRAALPFVGLNDIELNT